MTAEGVHTKSALADKVREFLTQFKDPAGSFSYVERIDQMVVKQVTYVVIDLTTWYLFRLLKKNSEKVLTKFLLRSEMLFMKC